MVDEGGWSLGEAAMLAVKATRGAGLPWGLAEEAGWAVRWLGERGVSALPSLAGCIADHRGVCAIMVGVDMTDRGQLEARTFELVSAPVLMIPFLAHICALKDSGAMLEVGSVRVQIEADSCDLAEALPVHAPVRVAPAPSVGVVRRSFLRVPAPSADDLAILEHFAARTYAPASEESRERGAGAGGGEND